MRAVLVASALALSAAFEAAKPAKPAWGKMGNWTKPAAVPWASIKTTQVTSGNGTNLYWFQNVLSDAEVDKVVARLGTASAPWGLCPESYQEANPLLSWYKSCAYLGVDDDPVLKGLLEKVSAVWGVDVRDKKLFEFVK